MMSTSSARVRVVTQSGPGECGCAALEMVVRYFVGANTRSSIERAVGYAGAGLTLGAIASAARACGLDAQAFALTVDELRLLPAPAILHLQGGHFVVFEGDAGGQAFSVVDPASGRRRVSRAEMEQTFTGAAVAFEPADTPAAPQHTSDRRHGLLWQSARAQTPRLALLAAVLVVEGLVIAAAARGAASILARWTTLDQSAETSMLAPSVPWAGLAALGTALAARWAAVALDRSVVARIGGALTERFARAVEGSGAAYLGSRSDGYLEALARDIDPLMNTQAPRPRQLLQSLIGASLLCVAASVSIRGAGLLMACAVLVIGRSALAERRPVSRGDVRADDVRRAVARSVREMLARADGRWVVAALGPGLARWEELRSRAVSALAPRGLRALAPSPATALAVSLAVTWVALVAEHRRHGLTLADTLLLQFLAVAIAVTLSAGAAEVEKLTAWGAALARLDDLCERAELARQERATFLPAPASPARGRSSRLGGPVVECRSVSYRVRDGEADLLRDLRLTVAPGEALAVVGGSGAGKTVLAQLLLGLVRPSSGQVLFENCDIWSMSEGRRRECIAGLLEGAEPVGGTIADNLFARGTPADADAARRACALLGIDRWIESLPLREASVVGRGGLFGVRQRRLLCLASLLVRPPQVLVLDATLDALDRESANSLACVLAGLPSAVVLCTSRPDVVPAAYRQYALAPP